MRFLCRILIWFTGIQYTGILFFIFTWNNKRILTLCWLLLFHYQIKCFHQLRLCVCNGCFCSWAFEVDGAISAEVDNFVACCWCSWAFCCFVNNNVDCCCCCCEVDLVAAVLMPLVDSIGISFNSQSPVLVESLCNLLPVKLLPVCAEPLPGAEPTSAKPTSEPVAVVCERDCWLLRLCRRRQHE